MSNFNKWNTWYDKATTPSRENPTHSPSTRARPYGESPVYKIGADFLNDCEVVEDWGCGYGWFAHCRGLDRTTISIDGSLSHFADKQADLCAYVSNVDGIFIRAVLEHNYEWEKILVNAVKSFRKKMVLGIFTPFRPEGTKEIYFVEEVGVPDIAFLESDLTDHFKGLSVELIRDIPSETAYLYEQVYLIEKKSSKKKSQ